MFNLLLRKKVIELRPCYSGSAQAQAADVPDHFVVSEATALLLYPKFVLETRRAVPTLSAPAQVA